MRNSLFICAFTLILAACSGEISTENPSENTNQTETNKTKAMNTFSGRSVVFYNVENLFDTKYDASINDEDFTPDGTQRWDEERYETKLQHIVDALSQFDQPPMLIGLVEIENRKVLQDLAQTGNFNTVNYGIAHFDSPDRRGVDVALLYDEAVFSVTESSKLRIKMDDDPNFATRDILHVEGELAGGVKTHVFVNHWSSRREGQFETEPRRVEAARTLREKVDEILADDADANIIILGDFNDHPDDKSLETVLRAKESGYEGEGDLINLLFDEHARGEGTAVFQGDWAVLDQIIVSQALYDGKSGLAIQGKEAEIIKNDELLFTNRSTGEQKPNATYGGSKYYGGYSDHLPVYIILN